MDRAKPSSPAHRTSHSGSRAGDRAHASLAHCERAVDGAWSERMATQGGPEHGLSPTAGLIGYDHLHWSLCNKFRLGSNSRETPPVPTYTLRNSGDAGSRGLLDATGFSCGRSASRPRDVHRGVTSPLRWQLVVGYSGLGDPKAWTLPAASPVFQGLPHRRRRRP